ncbi:MAG: helix-turn-helix domain-containing protein [Chloroflexota bacterium]|jgi:AraC-like DNA-binding protein/mannose-6-phosphate isomerase-like protein (cupin superfamily)
MDRDAIRRYLSTLTFDQSTLQFCERFDEQSRIWNFDKHAHPFFELIFFLEGKANIDAGSESVDVLGFDVVIYPPGLEHAEHLDLRRRQEIICLWADAGPTPPFGHAITLMDERGTLRSLFEMVYDEFTANRPCSAELISCYLEAIFLQVRQHFSEPAREAVPLVERSLGYIHEHYARAFDIDELARQVSVSPSYLFRLFKKKMDLTPMHYRTMVRIDKAKLLLADDQLTVDSVAQRVGFDDPKYFARVFRGVTGTTPSSYRRSRLAE